MTAIEHAPGARVRETEELEREATALLRNVGLVDTPTGEPGPTEPIESRNESVIPKTDSPEATPVSDRRDTSAEQAAAPEATATQDRPDTSSEQAAASGATADQDQPDTSSKQTAASEVTEVPVPNDISPEKAPPKVDSVHQDHSTTFSDLGFGEEILRSVKDVGYEEPTPIQLITIPAMMRGTDVIAQAQTGSGKTAAFGLPIIEQLDGKQRQVQAIILTPTRELAIQVSEALHKYGKHKRIDTLPIYGGQPYERQFRGLQRGPQIVVGTPGRVMDHMRRGTLMLDHVRFFVLDEADEMLDMGFIDDIEWVLEHTPGERQTALFSATMPPRITRLASRYMREPQKLLIPGKQMTVSETRQTYYEVPRSRKVDALTRILDAEVTGLTMIFCRTKHGVDELGEALQARGFAAETLHGDLSQMQRDRVMKRFRSGQAELLVATDVAARGLDVPDVTHVINFDIPESPEAYVHRVGRTGRAGRAGEAVTIVTPKETRWLRQVERTIKARIEPRRLPTAADVTDRRRESLKTVISGVLESEDENALYAQTISDLAEEHDLVEIAAAVLKLYADESGKALASTQEKDDLANLIRDERPRRDRDRNMARLFINLGRNFSVRPQDIVGAIANEANISGRSVGAIDIYDTYTFVDVPDDVADRVIAALIASGIKGKSVNVERSQADAGRSPRRSDRGGGPGRSGRPGGYRGGNQRQGRSGGGYRGGNQRGSSRGSGRRSDW